MRCVPVKWCVPSSIQPIKLWDDTGAAGGRPGSIWVVNSLDMIFITAGHDTPKETIYDLASNRFFIDSSQLPAESLNY